MANLGDSSELKRLREELLQFVIDELNDKLRKDDIPELSERIGRAIDARIDEALRKKLKDVTLPDPETFTRQVLAAAGALGTVEGGRRQKRPAGTGWVEVDDAGGRKTGARIFPRLRPRWWNGLIAVAVLAGLALFVLVGIPAIRAWVRDAATEANYADDDADRAATTNTAPSANGASANGADVANTANTANAANDALDAGGNSANGMAAESMHNAIANILAAAMAQGH